MRVGTLTATAAIVVAGSLATGATAAPTWLPPTSLTLVGDVSWGADVGMDSAGNAIAVWHRREGSGSNSVIEASVRGVDLHEWAGGEVISSHGVRAVYPRVAVDSAGNALAIWSQGTESFAIRAAYRPASTGTWQPQETVTTDGLDPYVDFDEAGNAVAVWVQDRGSYREVQASVRPVSTGVWGPPSDLSAVGRNAFGQAVSVNAHGDAIAVWQQNDDLPPILHSSFRPAGGAWQPSQQVSPDWEDALWPDIALDDAGNAIAVWDQGYDGIRAAFRPAASGTWDGPAPISAGGSDIRTPQVEFDAAGNAVALWFFGPWSGSAYMQAAVRPAGSGWLPAQNLSAPNSAIGYRPDLAVTPSGEAVAVWTGRVSTVEKVDAAVKPAGETTFGAAQTVSAQGIRAAWPQVAVDPAGDAVVAWDRGFDTQGVIEAAGFDGAGPVLADLSIPDTGEPGIPVSFSVSPFDVWSALAGPAAWTFGDGGTAEGNEVVHTYSAEGSYLVTVGAEDTLENATTESETIVIGNPPPPPPPPPPRPHRHRRRLRRRLLHLLRRLLLRRRRHRRPHHHRHRLRRRLGAGASSRG